MASRKQNPFTSFRILGRKAQHLIERAAKEMRKPKDPEAEEMPHAAENNEPAVLVHFSPGSIAKGAFVLLAIGVGAFLTYLLLDKIILLALGFFVAAIIDPGVRAFERMGFPRGIGILIQYVLALCVFMFLVVSLIPIIANQLQQIAILISERVNAFLQNPQISLPLTTADVDQRLTELVRVTIENLSINKFTDALQSLGQSMSSLAQISVAFATRVAGSVLGFIINFVIVLVLAFFIQMEKEAIRTWSRGFLSMRYRNYVDNKAEAVNVKIGQWARGQLLLGLTIGLLVFVALAILRIPYAATLAVLAGFTEFIPYVGPLIAAIPAILIALTEGGIVWALVVAGVYYVIQWCENNLLVPLIMKRAVGLSPIAIIFAMLVGLSFPLVIHPVLGLLLAVPTTTIISLFLEDWRESRRKAR